jgi:hypothetical protein
VTSGLQSPVPFQAHVELLRVFLEGRDRITGSIQSLLEAKQKPAAWREEKALLAHLFEEAFFAPDIVTAEQQALRGELQRAHWARGFRPKAAEGRNNDLPDAGEMMARAFLYWQQTRWPGNEVRRRYAHGLFNLYLLRALELLSMRIWDEGPDGAAPRLALVQQLLDELWRTSPADQPVLVRDARWLIPIAQSPTTSELHGYFDVAAQLATSLTEEDRLEVHRATIALAGGHLRSQLRYYHMQGTPLDDRELVLTSRRSNALDFSLTIEGLVPLMQAYEAACREGAGERRQRLASAILQGISADPELFVNRLDLLGPYTMIEPMFISGDGPVELTPRGQRQVRLLGDYRALVGRVAGWLHEDSAALRPRAGMYSPYGVIFGFSSNITEHMAFRTLVDAEAPPFSLEDAFTEGDSARREWVGGWRKLPHMKREMLARFDYPQEFAGLIFARIERALRLAASGEAAGSRTGRLFIAAEGDEAVQAAAASIAPMPVQYLVSSDLQVVAGFRARSCDEASLLHDRFEGELAVSYRTSGGWIGLSKDFLTDVLAAGRDVRIIGLPARAAAVLALMCRGVVAGE